MNSQKDRGDFVRFASVFKGLCKNKGVTQQQALADLGLNRNATQRWRDGLPSSGTLQEIAKYFEMSMDELLTDVDEDKKTASQPGDGNEIEFIKLFQKLSPEEQVRELSYLRELVDRKGM